MNDDLFDKLDPGFFEPLWLVVGFFAVVAVILLEVGAWRRRSHAIRLFAASHLVATLTGNISVAKRLCKQILLVAGVAFLFVALARPHLMFEWREEHRTGLDVLIAVDCSKSMLSEDVKPNRLTRAQLAVSDFADRLPENRLGLIAFAGDAFLQCPLTIDHDAFQTAVRELDTDTIPKPGTDIATAIDEAVQALRSQSNNMKFLILVTDGEDLEGRVIDAAKNAAQAGLKIYTIGVGTAKGELIPERDDNGGVAYLHDASGQPVQSKLDEDTLRQIASVTGGAYAPLGQNGEGLDDIYNRYIAPLPKQQIEERREKVRFERYEWPLALCVICLISSLLINERRQTDPVSPASLPRKTGLRARRKNPTLASVHLMVLAWLGLAGFTQAATTDTAERDYKAGKFDDAAQNYKDAAEKQPARSDLRFDLGDAAYKAGQFTQAEEAFRETLQTPDLGLQEQTYYNLGNTQFKHGEAVQKVDTKKTVSLWEDALHSYDSSLKLHPSADAKHNYEYVKEKLEELKKQQQQQQQQKNQNDKSQSKDNQSGQPQPDDSKKQDGKQAQPNPKDQQGGPKDQPNDPSGNKPEQNSQQPPQQPDQNGKMPDQSSSNPDKTQQMAHSNSRDQDMNDPGAKSRQEAEALLDSLKDDEKHVTARTLNGNNEPPPPPPSGKDW